MDTLAKITSRDARSTNALRPLAILLGSTALIVTSASVLASEAYLQEHTAPESATSASPAFTTLQLPVDFPLLHPSFTFNWRSYGLGDDADQATDEHTWATGGRLGVTFPEWHDWLSVGAAAYGSFPVEDSDNDPNRTQLVAPNGGHLLVGGESYINARDGNFNLRLFRQLLDSPYLNDQDNRMIPNVFEAYTLAYRSEALYAGFGYVSRVKLRNSDDYVSMAEAAGARGDSGVIAGGARWKANDSLSGEAFMLYNTDVFSTSYFATDYNTRFTPDTDLRLSAQFTSQRSVGEQRLGDVDTHSLGLKASFGYQRAVFTLAGTTTGDGAGIRSPFGQRPSYLSLMLFNFDRADEDAWLAGVSYRLDELGLPSCSFVVNYAEGAGAHDPTTHAALNDARETDLTLDYRPKSGTLEGLWLRLRYAEGRLGSQDMSQWRVTFNYELKRGQ